MKRGIYIVDIITRVFSGIVSAMRNPFYALAVLLIVLLFPLNLVDYFIIVIVNAGIAILNAILWILVIIVNGLIWIINTIIGAICGGLESVFTGLTCPDPMSYMPYLTQDWMTEGSVDIFGPNASVLGIILSLVGINFPLW